MLGIVTDWKKYLQPEISKEYFQRMIHSIDSQYEEKEIYPIKEQVFRAFNETPFNETKVVILGQDPYHGPGQANGLSFSVPPRMNIPPSLRNIFKELQNDLGCPAPRHGDLTKWARQGVLLLNTVLTVEAHQANSHRSIGWESFTDYAIQQLNNERNHLVFILWGKQALKKSNMIDQNRHVILHSPHPSPLSAHRGFFGSKPFSKTNEYLLEHGISPIEWCI
ncbi:uracil-DNA glycosylase [Halalkalibacillus sediminis]|uniref:Uracil-DNA glycosylase n=1 Tax=Halalkalibacillus sediminis TaxID=2018042 RepID=A0A2I0QWW3_9BACI|nr:uracil-DNA glycosylase [Halalkalibacillus sediminis]